MNHLFSLSLSYLDPYSILYSALKRTKAYSTLEDVRPTLRNKPAGLRADWNKTASRSSTPHRPVSRIQSSSLSTSRLLPSTPLSPSPESDHFSSLLAISPSPGIGRSSSPPPHGTLVPLIDSKMTGRHGRDHPPAVRISYLSSYKLELTLPSLLSYLVHTRTTKAEGSSLVSWTFRNGCATTFATYTSAESLSGCV